MEEGGEKERKNKKKRKKSLWRRRVFSPELDLPYWLCSGSLLLGAIKADLRVSL
jgi:hypothetical protein